MAGRGQQGLSSPLEGDAEAQPVLPRPGQTLSDAARQQLAYNKANPEEAILVQPRAELQSDAADSEAMAAAAAIGSQFVFSYQAYIPEAVVVGPGYSMDPAKPIIVFNGSNRQWWDVNNIHTKFDMRAYVGDTDVSTTRWVGETQRWHCGYDFGRQTTVCTLFDTETAPVDELTIGWTVAPNSTWLSFKARATNPLEPFAQPIDGEMNVYLDARAWRLTGKHDRMPVHQFWWAPFYSEGRLAYTSEEFYALHCLFPNVPGCTARVNINM